MRKLNLSKRGLGLMIAALVIVVGVFTISFITGNKSTDNPTDDLNNVPTDEIPDVEETKTLEPSDSHQPTETPIVENDILEIVNYVDLTHDGVDEKIVVNLRSLDRDVISYVDVYKINEAGNEEKIWGESKRLYDSGGFYLFEKDDLHYLMDWSTSYYNVYSLSDTGDIESYDEKVASFRSPTNNKDDLEYVFNFYKDAEYYLNNSIVLIDSYNDEPIYSTEDNKMKIRMFSVKDKLRGMGIGDVDKSIGGIPDIVKSIKADLKIGISKEKIMDLYDDKPYPQDYGYSVKHDLPVGEGCKCFRYDFANVSDYEYFEADESVDLRGLAAGKVKAILFVTYDDEDKMEGYTLYYMDKDNLYQCRVFEDGSVKDYALNYSTYL